MAKNEALRERLATLTAERDAVLAKCAPFDAQRAAAWEKVAAAQAEYTAIGEKIAALKTEAYRDACNEIAALSRALGPAHSLSAEAGTMKATPVP
ncbi:MAG: hypothetical protein M3547_00190 [Acidobacteriota bacterium]|nr:hypothetical protein [Acidobacteriota bacterium]